MEKTLESEDQSLQFFSLLLSFISQFGLCTFGLFTAIGLDAVSLLRSGTARLGPVS